MKRNARELEKTHGVLTRRAMVLGGAQLAFIGALGFRMRQLQLEQADQFRLLAEENRINIRLIPPARGELFDREGRVIARNTPSYRIVMVREDAGDVQKVITRLSQLIELDEEQLNRAMAEMERSPPFLPVTVAEQVSWEDVSAVAAQAVDAGRANNFTARNLRQ